MTLTEPGPVVIDTNIALDLFVFDNPDCAPLVAALDAGHLRWLVTAPMRTELARVLGYPLIVKRLAQRQMAAASVLEAFDARVHLQADTPPRAPCVCKDPDDQVFIDLAVARRALLISKDQQVLTMRKRLAAQGVVVQAVFAAT
ncbi:putative toxin-antitoxin system toxin component, PIN family [Variovorax sp. J22G73]|uniref:putative toxin-antitoxin system toxin component, PIN family n=1 Tax=unclassified Variovorax TaxID=663243 RepID=UPI0025781EB2|nr:MULTISPECIES: putative toxin-antitoxin system toxin component, PIN family [unclassified Variovorax]MDM0009246.1 putative toxin-antitoxin system toxin component, PIN family [Variovorax sp. J22R203]MDM0101818.1 putative toxin-antitoxin system toxin component, PIN family [Variovorax sp. J22G73]